MGNQTRAITSPTFDRSRSFLCQAQLFSFFFLKEPSITSVFGQNWMKSEGMLDPYEGGNLTLSEGEQQCGVERDSEGHLVQSSAIQESQLKHA